MDLAGKSSAVPSGRIAAMSNPDTLCLANFRLSLWDETRMLQLSCRESGGQKRERSIESPSETNAVDSHNMGLDTLELVIAIEEEFNLQISDADAERLGLLGDLHDYVVRALKQRGETPDETEVWERLKKIVVAQLGVRPERVTKSAHIVNDLGAD